MSRRRVLVAALIAPLLALSACGGDDPTSTVAVGEVDAGAEFEHDYTIPLGTADRIEAGEPVEIVPREMVVEVGESIRIVNDDDEGHIVGVFYVGAGETLTKQFASAGVLEGECSVHPSGQFTLRVLDA